MISIEDFKKSELRVGKVISAERIEGSDKLLKLMVDLGSDSRQILGGIASQYEPEQLIGKEVIVVANLEPRMLRGLESQGMILCADDAEGHPVILSPERKVPPGSAVK